MNQKKRLGNAEYVSQKVAEELNILKLSKEDREDYANYIEDQRVVESSIRTSWAEGEMKGKIEGQIEVALEMMRNGESNDKIRKYSGLTDDEIVGLRMGK
jgi:hypothetical protein